MFFSEGRFIPFAAPVACMFLLSCGTPAAGPQPGAGQPVDPVSAFPENEELLDLIASRVNEKRAVGLVLGVMDADGSSRIVSYGDAGIGAAPIGPNTIFEIGSITKVFTSTLLADMAARNEVELDAPVIDYLPGELALRELQDMTITLAHLTEQNSGLPNVPDNFAPKDPANPFSDYTMADLSEYFKAMNLTRAPGEDYEYSNIGVGLIGVALANQTGKSYEALISERILQPLGMTDTGINSKPQMKATRAIGHDQLGDPVKDWSYSVPFEGAGALRSSMTDMMKFLNANIGEPSTELERAMRTAQSPRADAGSSKIGLNWFSWTTPGGIDIVYHTGSTGGFSSYMGFDPVRGVGVVMLTNQIGNTLDIPVHLLDPNVPLREAPKSAEELGAIDLPAEALSGLSGTYVLDQPPRLSLAITAEGKQLYVEVAGFGKLAFHPRTPLDFFNIQMRAEITFVNDEDGKVSNLRVKMAGMEQTGTRAD